MKKLNQPEDVANCVVFLASDKAWPPSLATIVNDGGASGWWATEITGGTL